MAERKPAPVPWRCLVRAWRSGADDDEEEAEELVAEMGNGEDKGE